MSRASLPRVLGLILALSVGVVGLAADYPDCNWKCNSNDVSLDAVFLDVPVACVLGESVRATLYGTFTNGTGTDRYDVALLADLVIITSSGSTTSALNVSDLTTVIPPGTHDLRVAQVSFPCGSSVELRNLIISWDTKAGGDLSCA